jgi:ABC-2 type transport system permease protein
MFHLLKIEWLKYKNYRTFWILLLLIAISIPAAIYMGYDATDNAFPKNSKNMQQMLIGRPFSFPTIWHTASWIASMVLFIPSLLIITTTTNEFTYKTHRQNIIDGLNRTQFIAVKIVEVILLAVFVTLLVFVAALWVGNLATDATDKHGMFENIKQLGYFFIEAVSYLMLAFLLSIWIKRAGLVLGIFFLYSIIAEQVIKVLLQRFVPADPGRFLPLETTDQLLQSPFARLFRNADELQKWESVIPVFLALSAVYFLIYVFCTIYLFRTKDL